MLIDAHAHLNMEPLYGRWETVVANARQSGVTGIVVPGTDLTTSARSIEIAQKYPFIQAAVGIHPEEVTHSTTSTVITEWVLALEKLLQVSTVAAIGEIGLDYYRLPDNLNKDQLIITQRELFKNQLALAVNHHLPVIIHTRTNEAIKDSLSDIRAVYGTREFLGIFHCFTGSYDLYEQIHTLGGLVGVGGMITFSSTRDLQEIITRIPLEQIILETDSPLLSPDPYRGKTNMPANVTIVALKLAELKTLPLQTILEVTSRNAVTVFPGLKEVHA